MPTASVKLPDGTDITIDGTTEQVERLLRVYSGQAPKAAKKVRGKRTPSPTKNRSRPSKGERDDEIQVDHAKVVHHVKTCEEAEAIETRILDELPVINRVLLPLYIVHKYMDNAYGLTSGDVTKVTTDLGIPVAISNASRMLSGSASKYVSGDKVRTSGVAVRYKLIRRGEKYMDSLLQETEGDKQK